MQTTLMGVVGASGRMGRMILASLLAQDRQIGAAFVPEHSATLGLDVGALLGQSIYGVTTSALSLDSGRVDVLIDFSLPQAFEAVLSYCLKHKTALVMGVTGLSAKQEAQLQAAAKDIAIVYAGNYSTGVNLSLNLLATTAQVLGLKADVEIIESHHKHKLDAPSGTALMMAKAVADVRHQTLAESLVHGRQGQAKRQVGEIGMHAVRGGEIVGEHTVKFITDGEIIEITHKAQSRQTFADGAVRAGLWLSDKPAGLYDMQDVLGLKA